ncbi:MAG: hypothetical protein ACLFSQ_03010 [Candidatus Zixiibacteriota bacterium]
MTEIIKKYRFEILMIVIFFALAFLQGYHFAQSDLTTYIPFILNEYNPELLANDLLIETIDAHPVYIWKALATLMKFIDFEILIPILFVFSLLFLIISLIYFYETFFGRSRFGLFLFLSMLVITKATLAAGRFGLNPYTYFHPVVIGMGISFLVLAFLARKRWLIAGLLAGFVFLLHPFTAIFACSFYGISMITEFFQGKKLKPLFGLVLLLAISSFSWFPFVMHAFQESSMAFDTARWREIVEVRLQYIFFRNWLPEHFLRIIAALTLWFFLRKRTELRKTLPIVITVTGALIIAAIADFFTIKLFLQLQLGRSTYFLYILAASLIADKMTELVDKEITFKRLLFVFLPFFLISAQTADKGNLWAQIFVYILALGSLPVLYHFREKINLKKAVIAISIILILVGTIDRVSKSYNKNGKIVPYSTNYEWKDIQLWTKEHIPLDETIMTPIYRNGFRTLSQHAIYPNIKDGGPHNYNKKTVFVWWDMMEDFGLVLDRDKFYDKAKALYHKNAKEIALKNDIRYIVYDKKYATSDRPPLYENATFGIIDLKQKPDFGLIYYGPMQELFDETN